jgi:alpha-ketoglutarate-dependent 2,4-dichlorophenoxyacetate dioxygenase
MTAKNEFQRCEARDPTIWLRTEAVAIEFSLRHASIRRKIMLNSTRIWGMSNDMSVSICPLHPVFAGEVAGVDCSKPLSREEVSAIERGMDRYAVLVFRDQNITDEEQIVFTRHFGELESYATPGHIRKREDQRLGSGIADFSNLDKDGRIMSPEDRVWFFKLGDRLWHSDSSFRPAPAKYSILSGRVIPSWGANTEFADMRAAYDALDERTKAAVEDLICEHSLTYSREAIGFTDLTPEEIAAFRPVRQPLVRTLPVTGRKSLFLASHAGAIVGWTIPEARMFLRDLTEHATQREFVYAHSWRPHDLVMWDNRTTMHRARRFDRNEVRDMRRTTLAGDVAIVEQVQ